jgi:biofilm PGA synthesis lipoprotein PgaB
MRWLAALAILLSCCAASASGSFTVLCYHEIRDDVRDYPDPFAVDTAALVQQFAWLRGNGYVPVSLQDIVSARQGGKPLPDKAVLLSFDDAYLSFYTKVYPLLREFRYPAVLGVVGRWIDDTSGGSAPYGESNMVAAASFPSWAQLREMSDSGLVELASHSYDLHRGIAGNPQGNLQPAATTRAYNASGRYEADGAWRERVNADLARNSAAIERATGRRPRAIVWPYGSYNGELLRIAAALGMPVALTLEDGPNTPEVPLSAVRRVLIQHNPSLAEFAFEVRGPLRPEPLRMVRLSLDKVYSADPEEQEARLSRLMERMLTLKPTHVILDATSDTDGDGIADAAYFPTRHLPLRADLFNRAAWQLASRVDVKVFAAMTVERLRLSTLEKKDLFDDLARHAPFDGLVFVDGGADDIGPLANAASQWRAIKVARLHPDLARASADTSSDFVLLPAAAGMARSPGSPRQIYMLQGDDAELAVRMRALQLRGTLNFGYAGDDAGRDSPRLDELAPVFSLRVHPR